MLLASLRSFRPSRSSLTWKRCAAACLLAFSSPATLAFSPVVRNSSLSCPSSSSVTRSMSTSTSNDELVVHQFPCLSDNYGYLIHDPVSGNTAAIDTPDGVEILRQLRHKQWTLTHIFNTHHHQDHVGGNSMLHQSIKNLQVYGPATEKIPQKTHGFDGGDSFVFGKEMDVQVINVGGHTKGHIAYYFPNQHKLFCGDALFALGCGRMFEGTPDQFWNSLLRLRALPDETIVYCAHEYTAANAKFALSIEPSNVALQQRVAHITALRAQHQPTVPSILGDEKATNPFLRCDFSTEIQSHVMQGASTTAVVDPIQAFAKTRAAKDQFRG